MLRIRLQTATLTLLAALIGGAPAALANQAVLIEDGRLSVDLAETSLEAALNDIAEQAGFSLEVHGPLESLRQRRVEALPLAEGLRHLLDGYDLIMRLSPKGGPDGSAQVTDLVVLGRKALAAAVVPAPVTSDAPTTSPAYQDFAAGTKRQRLSGIGDLDRQGDRAAARLLREIVTLDPDPGIRINAAAALSRAPRRIAGIALTAALDDPEARVRIQAIRSLRAVQGRRALRRLQELAVHDNDPEVRRMAVHLSASLGGQAATRIFESALTDPTQDVRDAAAAALRESALN